MTHKGTVTLETERLILRRFTPEDAEPMFRNSLSDPKVPIYMTWETYKSVDAVQKFVVSVIDGYSSLSTYHWIIVPKDIGEPIGSIGVTRYNNETKCVEIGYSIGSKWWHKGYMSEALKRLVRFFFDEVGANRIQAQHDTRNSNSGKVLLKVGMEFEGVMRQSEYNNQGICDSAHYAILAEDYFGKKKSESINSHDTSLRKAAQHKTRLGRAEKIKSLERFGIGLLINTTRRRAFLLAVVTIIV
jgi:ribosomal-protein-alanine N-acetyltransferase